MIYSLVLNNARELNELAEENETPAYAGIAKVIKAWSFSLLTDLWNEVPYSEAFIPLPGGTSTPAYDSQEFIYGEIFSLLDEALEDFSQYDSANPAYSSLGNHDLLYGGDIERWERLTNTLIARFHMRLSHAPGYDVEEQSTEALNALANGFLSHSDDADFQYYSGEGEENPWYQFAIDGKWDTRNQLSASYIELLQNLNDPRLPVQARPTASPDTSDYVGHINGAPGIGNTSVSSIGAFYSAADAALNWLSFAEAKFIEAEAYFYLDNLGSAQNAYEEGIRASMEKLGVTGSEIDLYINSLTELADRANDDQILNDIITQKYIANFLNYEVFNDWRRTGYPELEPAASPLTPSGTIPVRFPYPNSELSNNAEHVAGTGIPIGFGALEENVWWDSNN